MHDSLQTRLEKTTWELLSFLSVVMLYLMHITHHFPCMVLLNICFWVDWYIGVLGHFQLFFFSYIVTTRKVLTDKTNWPIKPLAWVLHLETLTFDKGIDELTHISGVMLNAWCQKPIDLITQPPIYFIFVFGLISTFNLYLLLHKH